MGGRSAKVRKKSEKNSRRNLRRGEPEEGTQNVVQSTRTLARAHTHTHAHKQPKQQTEGTEFQSAATDKHRGVWDCVVSVGEPLVLCKLTKCVCKCMCVCVEVADNERVTGEGCRRTGSPPGSAFGESRKQHRTAASIQRHGSIFILGCLRLLYCSGVTHL